MKNNPEQIPLYIFEWLEQASFEGLRPSQQEEVLRYFSTEEYNELHVAASDIKNAVTQTTNHKQDPRKQLLMQRFDEKHRQPVTSGIFSRPVALWKAAAVLLLVGGGWFSYFILHHKKMPPSALTTFVDTLYVTKEVDPVQVKIYDTVYIERTASPSRKRNSDHQTTTKQEQNNVAEPRIEQLNIVSVKELECMPNNTRKNSMKDDSLVKQYSFITL